jgi:hypothetical protein
MFDPEFYPTPFPVIQKLIEPYRVKPDDHSDYWEKHGARNFKVPPDWSILEPSAGKGDICDYLANRSDTGYGRQTNGAKIKTIEKSFDLQQILMGKGYPVVGHDFLSYEPDQHFDLVVMNPPFSCGDAHLLHAWEVVGHGGHVACVLNAETTKNPYTQKRKDIVGLIAEFGAVEEIGKAFTSAERKTGVECVIVRLSKPKREDDPLRFTFDSVDHTEGDLSGEIGASDGMGLARVDNLGAMLNQYEKTKAAFVNFIRAMEELRFYGADLMDGYRDESRDYDTIAIHKAAVSAYNGGGKHTNKCNEFRDKLNACMWRKILGSLKMT